MNQPELATCHCIISHPSKPKFLVIRHDDRWSPPLFGLPAAGPMSTKAALINENMLQKYGLRTHVLRHWVSLPNYHCVELELRSDLSKRQLQAVWVGSEEYAKFRSSSPGSFDPFEAWLQEAEAGGPGPQRPWERPGWFQRARHWMQHELDRRNVQVTGSVEQFMAFRLASCVLRAATSMGDVFLKASTRQPPMEAAFTQALARRWPDWVPAPISVNEQENWALSLDYDAAGLELRYEDYPAIARGLAAIQLASMDALGDFRQLGCPELSPADLELFLSDRERLAAILAVGGDNPLDEAEFGALTARVAGWQAACRKLGASPVPRALVHNDLWYPNLYRRENGFWIADWSGAVIGHPFLSVLKLLRFRSLAQTAQGQLPGDEATCEALVDDIVAAYLEAFQGFDSPGRLRETLQLARELEGPWRLYRWARAIDFEEYGKFPYQRVARTMRRIARGLLD